MNYRNPLVSLLLILLPLALLQAQGRQENDPTLWPEADRAFYQDGPGLLLTPEQRATLRSLSPEARERWIREFLDRDPDPATPVNELREAISRRQRLADDEFLSKQDSRWQLLFLDGKPDDRQPIDCGVAFKPMEIWSYRTGTGPGGKAAEHPLVLYAPERGLPYRLWVPSDSKRVLFTPQMEYWLQQWEELHDRIGVSRFDLQVCKETRKIDEATGLPGLTGVGSRTSKIHPIDNSSYLEAPKEVAAWAREAATTAVPEAAPSLKVASAEMRFPESSGQRIVARALVQLPPGSGIKPSEESQPYVRLIVEGVVEAGAKQLEDFRMRFQLPAPKAGEPVVLAIDRALRPEEDFVLRLKIKDEVGGGEAWVSRGFRVPREATPEPEVERAVTGEPAPQETTAGPDSLHLLPPASDVLIGLWRADALVTGDRIQKVTFLVDGKTQLTTAKKPFSTEVRLASFPTEQIVRAEGYDADGKLVAADEVIVNQPRGIFNVRIVSPAKGSRAEGDRTQAKAEVVVPEGRVLRTLEFKVNDQVAASLTKPPWQAEVPVPPGDLVYLTAVATLDDGSHVEALRYLRAPENVSEVDVDLVELYTAVTDRGGNLVTDLAQGDFEVYESGKKQEIVKFDRVRNLPLTVCMLIDTSGSMSDSLASAEQAATGFLQSVMKRGDRAFAISFANRPRLEAALTDDVGAVVQAITGLQANGDTALHDALVHSLYYFRGVKGQRALVLLSDGDDNSSYISYKEATEYASRSGVAVYAIGLNLGFLDTSIKKKLGELAASSGGRAFFTNDPKDLPAIYRQIEDELRDRYLLAYNSSEAGAPAAFRPVEVRVKKPGLKARTEKGYYP